ncbi:SRPBCC family protein [Paraburkholderia graminis]|uniref:Activator of Hsp90 ATPase 1 family protein n=1 Tax=Paraburkholderia graminis (strain ATCC 700544 / DSM 17151 / LMG 18924 / NCIMB 13744 / C4D1M) TaxID=396598 RepID=B1G1T3_PARG4|nr:SRPBCC family protein [Paraburkholderia graminis]EDT10037.1 Activator of Hsp90 ATPase 1 family protein [Paraburkholderia graminis C4D1M]
MSNRDSYRPGPAAGAEVQKDGDRWTLVLVRELRHSPEKVWQALTDPTSLREWAPFDADHSLASVGPVKLSTVGTPTPQVSETQVTRADAPNLLEYRWGENDLRWQLESLGDGTRLTLWHNIDRKFISMGAAGLAHMPRRARPFPRGRSAGTYRRRRCDEFRMAASEYRIREAIRPLNRTSSGEHYE